MDSSVSEFTDSFVITLLEFFVFLVFTSDDNAQFEKMIKDKKMIHLNFNLFIINSLIKYMTHHQVRELL